MESTGQVKHWSKKSPETRWDYIVIGSGMGGMTAAALLAKLGRRVLVVEQHYTPGGFTHMFQRPGYSWDVGVHVIGEVTERSLTGRILSRLTDDRLKWASLGPVYEQFHWPDDVHIDFPDNPRQFRDNLVSAFPREEASIEAWLHNVKETGASMGSRFLSRVFPERWAWLGDRIVSSSARRSFEQTTQQVLSQTTADARLRSVLAGQWGYYGSSPSRSSFSIHAVVARHFFWGGYYPVGGARSIGRELLRTVADADGWTRIATPVEQILIENGRASGVRLAGGEELRSRRVISAAGVQPTARMLPESYRSAGWVADIARLPPTPAHVCLYLGFKGDIRAAGAAPANQWFCNTWNTEEGEWIISDPDKLPSAPVLYVSFPSLKDPTHDSGPEQRHTGEVVTFVPWKAFEPWLGTRWHHRGDDYVAFKEKLRASLLEQLFRRMPHLAPLLDFAELSTPLSTDHFARPVAGSIYSLEPTPERFRSRWLRARAPVDGLFFAGSDVASPQSRSERRGGFARWADHTRTMSEGERNSGGAAIVERLKAHP
jgi:all-trans-retinol 13,14-reductase